MFTQLASLTSHWHWIRGVQTPQRPLWLCQEDFGHWRGSRIDSGQSQARQMTSTDLTLGQFLILSPLKRK